MYVSYVDGNVLVLLARRTLDGKPRVHEEVFISEPVSQSV